jgi:hypothetical protein
MLAAEDKTGTWAVTEADAIRAVDTTVVPLSAVTNGTT